MISHMSNNRRCHPHLTNKTILGFLTDVYHAQAAAAACASTVQVVAARRITRTVLDVFSRLLKQSTANNKDVMEHSVTLLFVRMHERLRADESLLSAESRRLVAEISAMLDAQVVGHGVDSMSATASLLRGQQQQQSATRSGSERRASKLLESYV